MRSMAVRRSVFNHGYLFSSPATAFGVLTFVGMWQWTPFHTLIYQGGARAIPEVLYQAASIEAPVACASSSISRCRNYATR